MDTLESVLFVCRECQVFKIPPRTSNQGHKAADWADHLIWTGRLRVISSKPFGDDNPLSETCQLSFEDKDSGDLFASAPYDTPQAVEPVLDSSRYFVVRVVDQASGQRAYLGMGFQERTDAFDFNVALQEYTRRKNADATTSQATEAPKPTQDFSLKEGQTFSVNIGGGAGRSRPSKPAASSSAGSSSGGIPLIPPPPSANQVKKGL